MASLRLKSTSPYLFACYLAPDGRRVQRSTKLTKRKKAQVLADQWERAARLGAQKRLSEAQARRVLSDIYEAVNDEPLPSATVRDFLTGWAEKRKADTSPRTAAAYGQVARDFIASLGPKADRDVSQVSKADVAQYRDAAQARTSPATANKLLKYLRVALGAAWKDGLTQDNPAAKLDDSCADASCKHHALDHFRRPERAQRGLDRRRRRQSVAQAIVATEGAAGLLGGERLQHTTLCRGRA